MITPSSVNSISVLPGDPLHPQSKNSVHVPVRSPAEEEPGFGLYTDNGFFRGTVTAMTGSIKGILWINTSNAESMRLGRNVNGSSDGMFINSHNYWYTTGAFKMGTASNHIRFDGSSTLDVNFDKILINTSTFQVSSSLNDGTIRLGTVPGGTVADITSTTNTGVYMDGTGKFRVGESTNGDNFIYFDGTTTQIKSTNIEMAGTNFKLEASSTSAGEMWLGTIQATNDSSGVGFYATSSGEVRIYGRECIWELYKVIPMMMVLVSIWIMVEHLEYLAVLVIILL